MANEPHILVVDDEGQILRALKTILSARHFRVTTASRGEEALTLAAAGKPDLVILDLGLPDMDGIEVCGRLRQWSNVPIIVLSVRDSEKDKVAALDQGADDYLTKPFGIEELMARVRVALRHSAQTHGARQSVIHAADIEIDLPQHKVMRGGRRGSSHGPRIPLAGSSGSQRRPRPDPPRHSRGGLGPGGYRSRRVPQGVHAPAPRETRGRP